MTREEIVQKEKESWEALMAAVAALPEDARERDGAVPGWSAKDLVRHCTVWARDMTPAFEAASTGPWKDPFEGIEDAVFDDLNDRYAQEAKAMSWAEVDAEAAAWRPRACAALLAMAEPDAVADEFFAEETHIHYDEHREHIEAFGATLG